MRVVWRVTVTMSTAGLPSFVPRYVRDVPGARGNHGLSTVLVNRAGSMAGEVLGGATWLAGALGDGVEAAADGDGVDPAADADGDGRGAAQPPAIARAAHSTRERRQTPSDRLRITIGLPSCRRSCHPEARQSWRGSWGGGGPRCGPAGPRWLARSGPTN